ncbi:MULTISPECIES: hypothetical protein [Flavobacteriaceae]|uniref:Uncharacterized protein n=1 Tax=Flagellimonas alvinocaridis TaxID=2530200 RepID=A0A4S8RLV8_9FLAO|nr:MULTISPECIES: hypothetical protein [Allomuricauda]MDC6363917.1 hypothetical protein [Muricauda sp. SP22]THV58762.1 hypothetical protein EZV76_12195 [Allomuricauda alvinocaridis]
MPSNNPFIELSNFIEDTYGSPEAFAQQLDLAVEMLFYVEEDTFSRRELQEVASALMSVMRVLQGK